jgi:hypothetical protein
VAVAVATDGSDSEPAVTDLMIAAGISELPIFGTSRLQDLNLHTAKDAVVRIYRQMYRARGI